MKISNAASSSESSDTSGSSASSLSQGSDSESLQQSGSETEEYSDRSAPSSQLPRRRRAVNSESRKSRRQPIHHADESSQHSVDSSSRGGRGKNSRYSTRNQGRRTVRYQEDSDLERGDAFLDHDQSDLDGEHLANVSSRGRIRRPNPRVRTSL